MAQIYKSVEIKGANKQNKLEYYKMDQVTEFDKVVIFY